VENLFRSHAAAYAAVHRQQPQAQVGVAHNMPYVAPLDEDSLLDRYSTLQPTRLLTWGGIEASVKGEIPKLLGSLYVKELENSSDFIGVQYYGRLTTKFDAASVSTLFSKPLIKPGAEVSDINYAEVYPEGLYRLLRQTAGYGKPIYITENGIPDVDDDRRPTFVVNHLSQLWRAIREGVAVRGYYHWTLVDNFEWAEGWNLRFGLIEVDPETQVRRIRRSGRLYTDVCRENALSTDTIKRHAPEFLAQM
jgi:beta-glucosidase